MKTVTCEQKLVIDDLSNNLILFASAGTGKTFTVANRIANILNTTSIAPDKILCLTFTVKASKELSTDVCSIVGDVANGVEVKTIHGFCYKLIVEESKYLNSAYVKPNICDDVDEEEVLKSILFSNLGLWDLQKNEVYIKHKISFDQLVRLPVVCYNGKLYWLYNNILIDGDYNLYRVQKGIVFDDIIAVCPNCGYKTVIKNDRCSACGAFLEVSPLKRYVFKSLIGSKTALRNIVTEIKHKREELNLYSYDEISDYQKAFVGIKNSEPTKYQRFFTYFNDGAQYFDNQLESVLLNYVGKLCYEYDLYLKQSNLLDFDDIILKAKNLLKNPEVIARWQDKYKYIIVDEMQDTSLLEYSVLKNIFAKNNVMLCGDYFQTIYGWRGSNPLRVLKSFEDDFAPKKYFFTYNFRSTQTLTNATFSFVKNAFPNLVGKIIPNDINVFSNNVGDKINYTVYWRNLEAKGIYDTLLSVKNEGNSAIICRTNGYCNKLYNELTRIADNSQQDDKLDFFTVEQNQKFFKNPAVKDVFAVIKLLLNANDVLSMERLAEKYVPLIGIKSLEKIRLLSSLGVSATSFVDPELYAFGDTYYSLTNAFNNDNIVVFDTETTGLDLKTDQIVQISAIKINKNGVIIDKLDKFILPTVEISAEAFNTHGFDLDFIKANDGVDAKTALTAFSNFVKGSCIVGHNSANFDLPLINRQLRENGLIELEVVSHFDTMQIAKQFCGFLDDFKLSTLCQHFDVQNKDAHNAFSDITATAQCLIKLIKEYIIPKADDRIAVLSKYKDKFYNLFKFFEELRILYNSNQSYQDIIKHVFKTLNITLKYNLNNRDLCAEIIDIISLYSSDDIGDVLYNFVADAILSGNRLDFITQKLNKIPIITVHQSKGCEYDNVVVAGVNGKNFPSFMATDDALEEEKKVFYVAISRAKRKLFLTTNYSNKSPFIELIPNEYLITTEVR